MSASRYRLSGVANIIRFNWVKYVAAVAAVVSISVAAAANTAMRTPLLVVLGAICLGLLISLGVSHWVYDRSRLYDFDWATSIGEGDRVAVVHAGLDEVSATLRDRLDGQVHTTSFFDRLIEPEASIRRARDRSIASPPSADSDTGAPLLPVGEFNWIVAFMCLHELRTTGARQEVLAELNGGLATNGKLIVVEHLRDVVNTAAFSVGVVHFLPKSSWKRDFAAVDLTIVSEKKVTPFVSEFVLSRASRV